jgi:hypothetical protein
MDLYNKKMKVSKSKYIFILVFAAVFMCLLMVGNVSATDGTAFPVGVTDIEPDGDVGMQTKEKIGRATDGTTFPVDDAGIAAYVKVSESIELATVVLVCSYIEEMTTTYFIGQVWNSDETITRLYVGADGWVIPYYLNTEEASRIVRWNMLSDYDPTIENVTAMNTLEEVISRVCTNLEINYDSIKSEIKYYDFEFPDATNMVISYDIAHGYTGNSFELLIPSDFVYVYESSWSFYLDYYAGLFYDGVSTIWIGGPGADYIAFGFYDLSYDYLHQIEVRNLATGSEYTSGVGWVFVYRK